MPDFDPSAPPAYNSMQQQAGLLPMLPPQPVIFPGQVSAAIASGGPGAVMNLQSQAGFGAGMFPAQQMSTFTNMSPMLQGPTGIMMPMNAAAPFNAYAGMNPYAGLGARGPYAGPPGLYTPMAPGAPPAYSGMQGALPFAPPPPHPAFMPAYQASIEQQQATADAGYYRGVGFAGTGARIGTDLMGGMAGAMLGRRFGATGAVIGGLAGFAGMEFSGGGRFGQNMFMSQIGAPMIQERAMTAGIEHLSGHFAPGGPSLHASGMGFSHSGAAAVAASIREMAELPSFRRETGGRFNQQDLLSITQSATHADLMTGVQNPGQMTGRVREVAKSLSAFMELAQEPDIQRAIQTMGQLRTSGLNFQETMQAVTSGRTFARMAGTTFSEIMGVGGAMGSQTYQAMGLGQGAGMRTGMMNYGLSRASQNMGVIDPQLMGLMGGAAGYANMNNMFSGAMMQMPMLAPAIMSSAGGVNAASLQAVVGGGTSPFSQTGMAANALQNITGRQGVQGLGMAIAMQPTMQTFLNNALQSQGPFAQRNFEDRNIMNLMRNMNLSGSSGYMTAAQIMGMDRNQALARAQEMASPDYYRAQRQQIDVSRRENRERELQQYEAEAPGAMDTMYRLFDKPGRLRRSVRRLGYFYDHLQHMGEELAGVTTDGGPQSVQQQRELDSIMAGSPELEAVRQRLRSPGAGGTYGERNDRVRYNDRYLIARAQGTGALTAALESLGSGPAETYIAQAARFREVGRIAGDIAFSSDAEQRQASRRMGATFGSGEAGTQRMLAFTRRLQQEMRGRSAMFGGDERSQAVANTAYRLTGALASSRGVLPIDVGNMAEPGMADLGRIEQAYVESNRGNGRSDDENRTIFREQRSTIMQQTSANYMFSADANEISRVRTNAQQGAQFSLGTNTGYMDRLAGIQQSSAESIYGRQNGSPALRDVARRMDVQLREKSGDIGRTPREREDAARAMRAVAMYQAVLRNTNLQQDGPRYAQIRSQLDKLNIAIRQRFGDERGGNLIAVMARRTDIAQGIADDRQQLLLAEGFVTAQGNRSGAAVLDVMNQAGREGDAARGLEEVARGANVLAGRGGIEGQIFGGLEANQYSESRLEDKIGAVTADQLRQMREGTQQQRNLADAIQLAQSEDPATRERGMARIRAGLRRASDPAMAQIQERRGALHGITGLALGLMENIGITQPFARRIQERITATTNADRDAALFSDASIAAENSARGAGIGATNDPMLSAASELRQAAALLNSAVRNRQLDTILPS